MRFLNVYGEKQLLLGYAERARRFINGLNIPASDVGRLSGFPVCFFANKTNASCDFFVVRCGKKVNPPSKYMFL
jgi:hypothetical protein